MKRLMTCLLALLSIAAAPKSEPYVWKNVAIYGGGFVTGIITHPKEQGLIYCRTDIGGAYRWDAKSEEWIPLTDWVNRKEGNLLGIESLAIDPNDPDKLYIAAGTYTQSKDITSILRSSDQGRTFQRSDVNLRMGGNDGGRPVGERLAVDPSDGKHLLFGSRDLGLLQSTDAAATWKKVDSFPAIAWDESTRMTVGGGQWSWPVGISFVQFDTKNKSIFVGVCTKKTSLYRSTDGGTNWDEVANQPIGLRPNHTALASDGWLYISYADEPGPHEMNDGALWKLNTATGEWINVTPVKPAGEDKFGYSGVSVSAQDPSTLVACTFCRWHNHDQVFRSTDAGKTWTGLLHTEPDSQPVAIYEHDRAPYSKQSKPHWLGDVEIDPFNANHVMFVTGYGIWSSRDDLKHWIFANKGLEEIACLDLVSPPEGAHLVSFVGDQDGFRHDNLDEPSAIGRHSPTMGTNRSGDFAALKPAMMVRVGDNKPFGCWSSDGGATWNGFESIPDHFRGGTISCAADFSSIIWSPESRGSPQVSHDRGKTWKPCTGLASRPSVVADRFDPQTFYALTRGEDHLSVSHDAGDSFQRTQTPHSLPDTDHRRLSAVFGQAGELWLCAETQGLFHILDEGRMPMKLDNVTEALAIGFGKAAPAKAYPAIYLVGTIGGVEGVFRSDDVGKTWVRINDDQHQYAWIGQCVIGDPRVYGRVYLATNGRGILYADPKTP
jgi:photosystem II stability/assembly factor-like uncharacterized protein